MTRWISVFILPPEHLKRAGNEATPDYERRIHAAQHSELDESVESACRYGRIGRSYVGGCHRHNLRKS